MSQPRPIIPGATYLVTRRTLRRHHLLRPDADMHELVTYAFAVCAARYSVRVHGYCAMSTHIHSVVTDVDGTLPLFLAQFHRIVALATKVMRKWEGAVWDHEQTSLVRLETPEAVVDKMAYVIANPVAAGLVRYASDWPGAKSLTAELARGRQSARRPSAWFDPESWPDEAVLELSAPAHVPARDVDAWREAVATAVVEHERRARHDVERRGWAFVGLKRLRDMSPYERATSFEELRSRNPTFAVGAAREAYSAAVRSLRAFREAYRAALRAWREGTRGVAFPTGTWWMARVHAVVVAT